MSFQRSIVRLKESEPVFKRNLDEYNESLLSLNKSSRTLTEYERILRQV